MKSRLLNLNLVAAVLVVGIYIASLTFRAKLKREETPPGYIVVRIAHSRLEPGYREALDLIIKDFEELKLRQGVKVKVKQMAVANQFYEAWLNTQLIGGTAPDMVQMPQGRVQGAVDYMERYFFSLDEITSKPNPYNEFTVIEDLVGDLDLNRNVADDLKTEVPELAAPLTVRQAVEHLDPADRAFLRNSTHRDTFFDGMLGGYNYGATKYYTFTTVASQMRIFYNQEIFRRAQGSDRPPQSLGEFFRLCEKIQRLKTSDGVPIIPIAATKYLPDEVFNSKYRPSFLYTMNLQYSRDEGVVGDYGYLQRGMLSFDDPQIRAYYDFTRAFSRYCTPGYQSVERDNATFAFVQGRAAMRFSGAENAASLFKQTKFPIGVMPFPVPAPGERWSQYACFPAREVNRSSGQFALTRGSENPSLAQEFMYFWTSYIWNERFNMFAELVPVIKGSRPSARMTPFTPLQTGISSNTATFNQGGTTLWTDYKAEAWRFFSGEVEYEEFVDAFMEKVEDPYFGVNRYRYDAYMGGVRGERIKQANQNIAAARMLMYDARSEEDQTRYNYTVFRGCIYNNGTNERYYWERYQHEQGTDEPFPEFE